MKALVIIEKKKKEKQNNKYSILRIFKKINSGTKISQIS